MRTYRCQNPHPSRSGKCNKKLLEGDFHGWVALPCDRCGEMVTLGATQGTSCEPSMTVIDKHPVAV